MTESLEKLAHDLQFACDDATEAHKVCTPLESMILLRIISDIATLQHTVALFRSSRNAS